MASQLLSIFFLIIQAIPAHSFVLNFPNLNSASGATSITWDAGTDTCSYLTIQLQCLPNKYVTTPTAVSKKSRSMPIPVDWLTRLIRDGNTHCHAVAQCEDNYPHVAALATVDVYLSADGNGRPLFSPNAAGGNPPTSPPPSPSSNPPAPSTTAAATPTTSPSVPPTFSDSSASSSPPASSPTNSPNSQSSSTTATNTSIGSIQTTEPQAQTQSQHSSMGPILGGVLGGLVVVIVAALLFFCWRRQKRIQAMRRKRMTIESLEPSSLPLSPSRFVPSAWFPPNETEVPASPSTDWGHTTTTSGRRSTTKAEREGVLAYSPSEDSHTIELTRRQILELNARVRELEERRESELVPPPRYSMES